MKLHGLFTNNAKNVHAQKFAGREWSQDFNLSISWFLCFPPTALIEAEDID